MNFKQQAPGKERLFSKPFCVKEAAAQISAAILECIADGREYNKKEFISDIKKKLNKDHGFKINNSCESHYVTNILYYGFIEQYGEKIHATIRISLSGRALLEELTSPNCDNAKAIEIILGAMRDVHYPNKATRYVNSQVKSFPFRILFRTLLREGYVTGKYMNYMFPYIINSESLDNNPNLDSSLLSCGDYEGKWLQWIISMLHAIGVLTIEKSSYKDDDFDRLVSTASKSQIDIAKRHYGDLIKITPEFKSLVNYYFGHLSVNDLFSNEDNYNHGVRAGSKNTSSNNELKANAKKRDNYTCVLTGNQANFRNKDGYPFCHGHHGVPMEYYSYYLNKFNVDIDNLDNIFTVAVEVHECIHKGHDEDRKNYLIKIFDLLPEEFKLSINLTKEEYFKFYNYKENLQNKLF